jgi:regulator of cell morphogenesis and NO signaling
MQVNRDDIRDDGFVTDIVIQDYRTAAVFRKYGIDYCCGGKLPLQMVCEMRGIDTQTVIKELTSATRNIQVSGSTNFNSWSVDFLVEYIINVHHAYLITNLPDLIETLERFVAGHQSKYPFLAGVMETVLELREHLLLHLAEEESVIFPYIRQIAHAYNNHEPYAALLVRTLRKPIENLMNHEQGQFAQYISRLRILTNNYTPAAHACISHKVSFAKLQELEDDLVQHIHLESNILFPKAIAMEKEMLALK